MRIFARILGVCLLGELVILMIFSFAVLFKGGGPDGIMWNALNPAGLFSGGVGLKGAAAVFGVSAAGVGFFGAYWSWVGFEMAPNYAEEARNPKKMMAYATYILCLGLAVVFTFWAWMLVTSYGGSKNQWPWAVAVEYGVKKAAPASVGLPPGDYASVYYPVAQAYVGTWLADLFKILIITGSFACSLAFWNTSNRYLFSMGRETILPRVRPDALDAQEPVRRDAVRRHLLRRLHAAVRDGHRRSEPAEGARDRGVESACRAVADRNVDPFQGNLLLFPIMALCSVAIMFYFREPGTASTGSRRWSPRSWRRRRSSSRST